MNDNGETIARSEEAFLKGSILASIKKVRAKAGQAPIAKNESPEDSDFAYRFEYDQCDKSGAWHWRLRAGNHETMAVGNAYTSEDSIKIDLNRIKAIMCIAKITWENPEDDPAHQEKCNDRTENKGIAGS